MNVLNVCVETKCEFFFPKILTILVKDWNDMCSLIECASRTECHALTKSLCFHEGDRSMMSKFSRSISCW